LTGVGWIQSVSKVIAATIHDKFPREEETQRVELNFSGAPKKLFVRKD
jgi:hypothetical protein